MKELCAAFRDKYVLIRAMASEIGAFRLAVTDHLWVRWSGQRDTWNKKSSISPNASMLTVTDWGEKGAHDKKHPLASAYLGWILLLWVGDFLFLLHHISYWEPGQAYQFCLLPCIIYETSLANGARPYSYLLDTLDIYINEYQFILLMAVIAWSFTASPIE